MFRALMDSMIEGKIVMCAQIPSKPMKNGAGKCGGWKRRGRWTHRQMRRAASGVERD